MDMDRDLLSIQEVRHKVALAKTAQKEYQAYSQSQIDQLVEAVGQACVKHKEQLAQMAVEDTGFGNVEDKVLKNLLGSQIVCDYIRGIKTVGILSEDTEKGICEIGVPVGLVAALIPSTNPTSTTMYKAIISLKAGNGVIFSPHPSATRCILATVEIIRDCLKTQGAPVELVQVISTPTIEATNELMSHKDVNLILATGGPGMVKAAYSSGTPAIGVGAGNGPAFIEKSANVPLAVKHILDSKTFDNGTICASEQSIVTEASIKNQVIDELKKQGAYMLNAQESQKVASTLLRDNGSMNPEIVGKTAVYIAEMAGISVPDSTRVLVSEQTEVSHKNPYSREKLCPVLGFYVEAGWLEACKRSIEILENEGIGHTMAIHSENQDVIREFALQKPVMRLLVNTPASLGGVGVTTNLAPALTLGCGAVGGTSTSDNITPLHLINIRRIAYGRKELEDVRATAGSQNRVVEPSSMNNRNTNIDMELIVTEVVNRVLKNLK